MDKMKKIWAFYIGTFCLGLLHSFLMRKLNIDIASFDYWYSNILMLIIIVSFVYFLAYNINKNKDK